MKSLHKHSRWLPVLVIFLLTIVIFRKFLFQGLLPIPYNIMVGWYFPFNLGGWEAYQPGIIYKGGLYAADVFRQMIPWKNLALEMVKSGQIPWWNPYAFSGEPLLANIQVTMFYPLTLLFFIFNDFDIAWSIYILLTPLISSLGMYWFLKSQKLINFAALIGALAFGFSGHMFAWMQWGVVTHSAIWLPYILLALNKIVDKKKPHFSFYLLLALGIFSTITGGYPQESAYVILISFIFGLFKFSKLNSKTQVNIFVKLGSLGLLTLFLLSPQIILTGELYQLSALKGETSSNLFKETGLSWKHGLTVFAPDFYGNRITNNYWAETFTRVDYIDANLFIGTLPLIFLLCWLVLPKKTPLEKLFLTIALFGLLIGLDTPVGKFWADLQIPMLSTGVAAGSLFLTISSMSILAGFGTEKFFKHKSLGSLIWILHIYLLFSLSLLVVPAEFKIVAARNSVIPLGMAGVSIILLGLVWFLDKFKPKKFKLTTPILIIILIGFQITETSIYANKMLSFSPTDYSYPQQRLITELKSVSGLYRSTGFWDSEIVTNFYTHYKIYSSEGYNPLHSLSYQQLTAATKEGQFTKDIQRSDADLFVDNSESRNRFMVLTSTKYVTAKVTDPVNTWETEPLKYDDAFFSLIWQAGAFKIYEFGPVLERVSLFNDYQVINNLEERINRLYDPLFDPHKTLILESDPEITINPNASGSAKIVDYSPNQVLIDVKVEVGPILLMLNDNYYPGWIAEINNKQSKIYKANHTFRAVVVPEGEHEVRFVYRRW